MAMNPCLAYKLSSRGPIRHDLHFNGNSMSDDDDFKGASAPIPRMSMRVFPPALSVLREQSSYETRGWTFQEELLSMRCLYLTEAQAYFRCPHGVLREDGADGLPDDSKSTELLSVVPLLFWGAKPFKRKKIRSSQFVCFVSS